MTQVSTGTLRLANSNAFPDAVWGYLECCPELGRYYRKIARFRFGDGIYLRLMKPAWGTHMTIIRREVPGLEFDFSEWEGKEVEFEYFNLRTNGKHVWLDCECDEMLEFRRSIGLPMLPAYPLHVTVGVMPGDI